MEIKVKHSGTKNWAWITAPIRLLIRIAIMVGQPIKPAAGNQPAHIDLPLRRNK
jgi:hypothetical protein